jgi:hypothetical protein
MLYFNDISLEHPRRIDSFPFTAAYYVYRLYSSLDFENATMMMFQQMQMQCFQLPAECNGLLTSVCTRDE